MNRKLIKIKRNLIYSRSDFINENGSIECLDVVENKVIISFKNYALLSCTSMYSFKMILLCKSEPYIITNASNKCSLKVMIAFKSYVLIFVLKCSCSIVNRKSYDSYLLLMIYSWLKERCIHLLLVNDLIYEWAFQTLDNFRY